MIYWYKYLLPNPKQIGNVLLVTKTISHPKLVTITKDEIFKIRLKG